MNSTVVVYRDSEGKIKVKKTLGIVVGNELKYPYTSIHESTGIYEPRIATCRLKNFLAISSSNTKISWSAYIDETISEFDVFEKDVYSAIFMMADKVKS